MATTVVVSDLHLGGDLSVLSRPNVRSALLAELEQADEVVLLGDTLDLRHAPIRRVLDAARPVLAELGRALDGRRVVLVAGNHDHQLAAPVLERSRLAGEPLALEAIVEDGLDGPTAALVELMPGARIALAYPGLWIRDDVYATHGHYLDCHVNVARPEVIGASIVQRLTGRIPQRAMPADYEAALTPLYSFLYELAQSGREPAPSRSGKAWRALKVSAWRQFENHGGRAGRRRDRAMTSVAVAALNRFGLGPFRGDYSPEALGHATLAAMGEVVERLGIEAEYVVFGHTHWPGPVEGQAGWTLASGTRLVNTGSWGVSPTGARNSHRPDPYQPGTVVLVRETGPPELRSLLDHVAPEELRTKVGS